MRKYALWFYGSVNGRGWREEIVFRCGGVVAGWCTKSKSKGVLCFHCEKLMEEFNELLIWLMMPKEAPLSFLPHSTTSLTGTFPADTEKALPVADIVLASFVRDFFFFFFFLLGSGKRLFFSLHYLRPIFFFSFY